MEWISLETKSGVFAHATPLYQFMMVADDLFNPSRNVEALSEQLHPTAHGLSLQPAFFQASDQPRRATFGCTRLL